MGFVFFFGATDPKEVRTTAVVLRLTVSGAELPETGVVTTPVVLVLGIEGSQVGAAAVLAVAAPTAAERLAASVIATHEPRSRIVTLTTSGAVRRAFNPSGRIVLSGVVTDDRTREVRRSATLALVDEDGTLAPAAFGDQFAQGERFRLDRGVLLDGASLYELLGVFEVVRFDASMRGELRIAGDDPSTALRTAFGDVVTIAAGTSAEDALRQLWEPTIGDGAGWDLDGGGMSVSVTRSYGEDEERLHAALQLMSDLGLEVWMDRAGVPVMRPLADPTTSPVTHTFEQARGSGLATFLERSGVQQPYNRQVVIGERPDGSVVRGVADVTDPASPIHADRIGLRVAPIHRSAQITTQNQANVVARARLIEASLFRDTIRWTGVPDPTIEAGDVAAFVEPRTGTDVTARINRVSIPVGMGEMSLEATRVLPLFDAAA